MQSIFVPILMALGFNTYSTASPLKSRAGGPVGVPIPSNCSILGADPDQPWELGGASGSKISEDFAKQFKLYQAFYETERPLADVWKQCIEQCYGFGTLGTCQSALLAYNVRVDMTSNQGEVASLNDGTAMCTMFSQHAGVDNFVAVDDTDYSNETFGNIFC